MYADARMTIVNMSLSLYISVCICIFLLYGGNQIFAYLPSIAIHKPCLFLCARAIEPSILLNWQCVFFSVHHHFDIGYALTWMKIRKTCVNYDTFVNHIFFYGDEDATMSTTMHRWCVTRDYYHVDDIRNNFIMY